MASFDELETLAAKVDRDFRELRDRAATASARTVAEEVAGGAGVVRVGLNGALVGVELDPAQMGWLDERRLGPMLVAAVRAAEARARQERDALLATPEGTGR
ncbi:hypothetical protein [Amycolatopsis anabasis]|uniref:hypothetical protein n=1 Tax=Amycolatopsis anabasis TaxID=1840409 RepID=UPI00131E4DE9|nr:hypothetical protein [Amycolatopsis anabasis]